MRRQFCPFHIKAHIYQFQLVRSLNTLLSCHILTLLDTLKGTNSPLLEPVKSHFQLYLWLHKEMRRVCFKSLGDETCMLELLESNSRSWQHLTLILYSSPLWYLPKFVATSPLHHGGNCNTQKVKRLQEIKSHHPWCLLYN